MLHNAGRRRIDQVRNDDPASAGAHTSVAEMALESLLIRASALTCWTGGAADIGGQICAIGDRPRSCAELRRNFDRGLESEPFGVDHARIRTPGVRQASDSALHVVVKSTRKGPRGTGRLRHPGALTSS